jgi:hypothetical protein
MKRLLTITLLTIFTNLLSACASMVMPAYTASMDNVETLKKAGAFQASIGEFTSIKGDGNPNPISMRGSNTVSSPYQDSYAGYVAEALRQEFTLANKLAPNASIELSGMLIKNDIEVPMGTGHAHIEVRMIVRKDGQVRYDQIKKIDQQWESSFAAATAIPLAINEYPVAIQKLLGSLYGDAEFIKAIQ